MDRAIEVLGLMKDEKVKYAFNNFVCSSVISGFCKVGKPELALGFFEDAVSVGALRPNVVTYTSLVSALCMLGRVDEVRNLVSQMVKEGLEFDVVFYSSWICGYFRGEHLMKAFRKHREMVKKGIITDIVSWTTIIDGFSKEGNVEKVVGFLDKMVENGLKPNLFTYTTIILGFCKKGKMDKAFEVFKMVEDLGINIDEYVYAILIDGFCRIGDFDCAYQLLGEMEKKGIYPTIVTYNTLINGLCKLGRTSEADKISKGVIGDAVTYSTLLHGYILEESVAGILEIKRRSKEARAGMDIVMCNILIKSFFMVGAIEDAHVLYKRLHEMNLIANSVTYCTMIDGYCKVGMIEEALEIFDECRKKFFSSVACYNCMLNGLCKNGMVDVATEVFVELNEKGLPLDVGICNKLINAVFKAESAEGPLNLIYRLECLGLQTYDTICAAAISILCKRKFLMPAVEVYMVARRNQIVLTCKCYYLILKGLISDGKLWLSQLFLSVFIKEYGLVEPKVGKMLLHFLCIKDVNRALQFLCNLKEKNSTVMFPVTVLKALTKDGKVLAAYKLIKGADDNLPAMDVVDYSIIVDGLCKGGYPLEALSLCTFAEKKGITLNIVTYNSVINGLCLQGCLVEAFRLFDSLERIKLIPSEITYAILIDNLCKDGYLFDAKQLFKRMFLKGYKSTTRIYNSFLNGYCKFGQVEKALKILNDMEIECLDLDEFTMSALIKGYCQKGDMEGALRFFSEYKKKGISPDLLCFLYLIRGLYSKGRMEEARSILREMLQSQSVMEMINRVGTEAEIESIETFLVYLCEQGSIKEAVTVLNEIGSMLFPIQKSHGHYKGSQELHKLSELKTFNTVAPVTVPCRERTELEFASGDAVIVQNMIENADNSGKKSQLFNFNKYFSLLSSHCSRGEISKANRLAKEMFLGLVEDC